MNCRIEPNILHIYNTPRMLLGACNDGILRLWNTARFVSIHLPIMLFQHPGAVLCCLNHPKFDREIFFTGAADGIIRLWKRDLGEFEETDLALSTIEPKVIVDVEKKMTGHEGEVTCLAFDPEVVKLYSADSNGVIKIWVPDSSETMNASWICFKSINNVDIVASQRPKILFFH